MMMVDEPESSLNPNNLFGIIRLWPFGCQGPDDDAWDDGGAMAPEEVERCATGVVEPETGGCEQLHPNRYSLVLEVVILHIQPL